MISRIKGIFETILDDHSVLVAVSGISYQILLPAITMKEVQENYHPGDSIMFTTIFEIETTQGFNNIAPRLVGFFSERDRKFFIKLVKVRDFGTKRAIRSLIVPFDQVASAIERADVDFLVTLPEIGRRSAEKIIAELKGKMTEFLSEDDASADVFTDESELPEYKREALLALQQMGYKRQEAHRMINNAMKRDPDISDSADLLREVFASG